MASVLTKIKATILIIVSASFISSGPATPVTIRHPNNLFTADNLGNMYVVDGSELLKYLPGGKLAARYSNLKLGDITSIDATNPLKIILYYRDFQQVVFLDNQLSANTPLSLEKIGLEQASLVCAASNNGFWVYNRQNNELVRFNETARQIIATGNLKQVLNTEINPDFMVEHNGFLFLNNPANGIYVFDIFGAFSKVISIKGLSNFDPDNEIIYYRRDSLLCSYRHRVFEESCKGIPFNAPRSVKYLNKRLYCAYNDSLITHEF
jgi:hypothetical protein